MEQVMQQETEFHTGQESVGDIMFKQRLKRERVGRREAKKPP